MNHSPETVDAALSAWALVDSHVDECPGARIVLFSAGDAGHWKCVANHLAEQLAYRVAAGFGDRSGDVIGRVRSLVLASSRGDERGYS